MDYEEYEQAARKKLPVTSTKVCYFLKEGDNNSPPVRMPVNTRKQNIQALEDELTNKIPDLPYGVRSIFTRHGRTLINNVEDLESQAYYVCATQKRKKAKPVDLDKVPAKKKVFNSTTRLLSGRRDDNKLLSSMNAIQAANRMKKPRSQTNGLSTIHSESPTKSLASDNSSNTSVLTPRTPKKVTICRNGKERQQQTMLVNFSDSSYPFEQFLKDACTMLGKMPKDREWKMYTQEGREVSNH